MCDKVQSVRPSVRVCGKVCGKVCDKVPSVCDKVCATSVCSMYTFTAAKCVRQSVRQVRVFNVHLPIGTYKGKECSIYHWYTDKACDKWQLNVQYKGGGLIVIAIAT